MFIKQGLAYTWSKWNSDRPLVRAYNCSTTRESSLTISWKLNIHPLYHLATANTLTHILRTALFMTAQIWKKPRCPSASEWISRLGYIRAIEYSTIKRVLNRAMANVAMSQNNTEGNKTEKVQSVWLLLCKTRKRKAIYSDSRLVVA